MRKLYFLSIVAAIFLLSSCKTNTKNPVDFVKVKNLQFVNGGKPYYFLGTNLWYGAYLGSKAPYGNRERLTRELDQLSSLGVKNLRILAASENSEISNSLKPAFIISPGKYNNDLLEGLDFLMEQMNKRDMKAVLFLNNFWEWSGGMGQYLSWVHGGAIVDPVVGPATWSDFIKHSTQFYFDSVANTYYHDYIRMLINRVNTCTGKAYRDDPAIMAWELANEPRGGEGNIPGGEAQFCRWIDQTAYYIHSLDKNHLVTTGSEGLVGCHQDSALFIESNKSPNIDYLCFHLWAKNWGWFDAKNISGTYAATKTKAIDYINRHIALARELDKPIVMEEFGMERDSSIASPGTPVTARDNYYNSIFKLIADSAVKNAPLTGSNFWGWGGEGRPAHADHIYKIGDPFMADPPQEGQGLNSIYNNDSSTIQIIRKYAVQLNLLNK